MSTLSADQVKILNDSRIIKKWQIFHFPSLCSSMVIDDLGSTYLNEICDPTIEHVEAVKLCRRYVLKYDSDRIYSKIVAYCKEKSDQLTELISCLWIDMDKVDENNKQLTKDRYNLLLKNYDSLRSKFERSMTSDLIISLVKENSTESNLLPPTAESLIQLIIRKDSKEFYDKICKVIQDRRYKFKDCYKFMSNLTQDDEDVDDNGDGDDGEIKVNKAEFVQMKMKIERLEKSFFMELPSEKMKNFNESNLLEGMPNLFANCLGLFSKVDWKIYGNPRWPFEWNAIVNKNYDGILFLPYLILPSEVDGWTAKCYLRWDVNQDCLIFFMALINADAPENFSANFRIEILFDGNVTFTMDKLIVLNHKSGEVVWNITKNIDNSWPLPTIIVQVKKNSQ